MGDLISDEARLADAGEENGATRIKEGLGEGEGLGEVEVLEEEIEMALLGFEEIEEGIWVNFGRKIGRGKFERPH